MQQRKMAAPLAMAAAVLWANPARATLIELDDPVYGAASITRDTDQNLDWLDVPISAGRSYDDVSIQFGPGGDFEGFRYALKSEVAALYNSVGIFNISGLPPSTESYGPAVYLQALVGETEPTQTLGVTGSVAFDPPNGRHFGSLLSRNDDDQTAYAEDFEYMIFDDAVGTFGHWLVRPVPEPSSLPLVAAGLLILSRVRRENR